MSYFIGADLGTSSLKLMLMNGEGKCIKTVSEQYPIFYPKSGWSEQNPEDWWNAFVAGIKKLNEDVPACEIKGIGVGGQMHGLVVLDKDDNPIRPAILWNDGRTQKETDYLNNIIGKENLSEYTANIAFAGFTAPKILWLKENEPENFAAIDKIMLPKDYINYKLTGVHCTDFSDASGMLLLDVKNKCWSEEMIDICGIKEAQLPKLFESYEAVGKVKDDIAKQLGLCGETVVAAGAGDNAAAAIGTATVGNGKCNISLGTSGTIFVSSDKFSLDENNALHSFCHSDGKYHLMGCILSAASCNKWFCESLLGRDDYKTLESAVGEDLLGNNEVFFLPYLMGERSPINDTNATGIFIGIRPDTSREQMQLAVLEGVAFAIRDNIEVVRKLNLQINESCLCGGGGKSELWQKIMANVLNIKLNIPMLEEGPAYGGAILAMVAADEYESVNACMDKFFEIKNTIEPDEALVALYENRYRKFKKIYPSIKQLYKEIKEN